MLNDESTTLKAQLRSLRQTGVRKVQSFIELLIAPVRHAGVNQSHVHWNRKSRANRITAEQELTESIT